MKKSPFKEAIGGGLMMAAVCTFFDWVWNEVIPIEHNLLVTLIAGLAHGAILFIILGGYLGALHKGTSPRRGAIGGLGVGLAASLPFYLIFPLLALVCGPELAFCITLLALWLWLWILLAFLNGRLSVARPSVQSCVIRGVVAAMISAPGFLWIITLWAGREGGFNYLFAFAAWTLSFGPALLALIARRSRRI